MTPSGQEFRIPRPAPRRVRENIVPMINVVFLLLIFFLMTAQIAPPDPIALTPPEADAGDAPGAERALHVGADGTLAYGDARGDAAIDAVSRRDQDTPLMLRADAQLPADELAALLPRLAQAGVSRVALVTVRR